jgi:hypothetical protein
LKLHRLMTVAELIEQLQREKPYLVVQVWDSRGERFTDRFYLQPATFDSELLITPSEGATRELSSQQWPTLFDERALPGTGPAAD